MNATEIVMTVVGSVLGGTGLGALGVKYLNRDVDSATADATRSGGKKDDLDVLRGVIAELREDKVEVDRRLDRVNDRLAKLEERERHMLTRAAVHEAWDQIALASLLRMDPNHPHPPPLTWRDDDDERPDPPTAA